MPLAMKRSTRLSLAIGISFSFFIAEISIGFKTRSIALIADAFHYLNDLIGFVVALVAILISEKGKTHKDLTFGWQRATLLGAFFNGVFLLALGVSILLQSLERFINLTHVESPMLIVIIGAIGLVLNIISIAFLHEHDHGHGHEERPGPIPLTVPSTGAMTEPEIAMTSMDVGSDTQLSVNQDKEASHHEHRHIVKKSEEKHDHHHHHDLGMAGVLLHIAGDAVNNIGVIIAGLIVWKMKTPGRFYADPAVGVFIALMILFSSLPLGKPFLTSIEPT
jgi:zinc transporter 1